MTKSILDKTLTSAADLSQQVSSLGELTGANEVVQKTEQIQKRLSQIEKAKSLGEAGLKKIQTLKTSAHQQAISSPGIVESGKGLPSSSASSLATSLPSSLGGGLDAISSLLNKSPSGLQFTLQAGNLPPNTFKVVSFEYREAYSTPFEINLLLSSPQSAVNFSDVLDNQATLSIWRNGELLRSVSGMVSSFEQGDSGFRQTFYRMEINPELWRLGLRRNSRIFQNESPIDILQSLLTENGVTQYRFDLRHEHPPREFCVQYRETDLAFLQRLSAEEGLTYYFEQDGGQTKLIFSDDAQTLNNGNAVSLPYNLNKKAQLQETVVTAFNRSERVRPSEVKLKDYTFKNPSWTAEFDKAAGDANNQRSGYEHYDYPGRFKDENQGKAFTQYRLESLRTDAHQGWGTSNSAQLSVGGLLQLTNHPNASLNTLWQISRIVYRGSQPQALEQEGGDKATTLENEFEFIPRHQSWRPMQLTKPRVEGPQIAIVVGPKDEEIYCDKFGRIKLQFLWDREGQYNDHSSCWIRVTQPWAGKNWGMIAIPRVGQEIVVDFLEGDPDQPIVTGRTYHATNMPPDALPAAKTQMNLMSQTYKGGGYNGLMMDDATNNQRLDLHAQKNMNTKVLNDQTASVGNNRSLDVTGNDSTTIGKNRTLDVKETESTTVGKGRSVTISEGNDVKGVNSGDLIETVSGTRYADANVVAFDAKTQLSLQVGKDTSITMVDGAITFMAGSSKIIMTKAQIVVMSNDNILMESAYIGLNDGISVDGSDSDKDKSDQDTAKQESESEVSSVSGEASLVSQHSSGVMAADAKLVTAQGSASLDMKNESGKAKGSMALTDLQMTHQNGSINSKVGAVSAEGSFDQSSIRLKGEAVVASLEGEYKGDIGKIKGSAKTFSADAELISEAYLGKNGKYGGEFKASAQAAAIAGEISGCLGTEDSVLMVCGKLGTEFGVSPGSVGGKGIVDTNKETVGVGGNIKLPTGLLGAEGELQFNWKALKGLF